MSDNYTDDDMEAVLKEAATVGDDETFYAAAMRQIQELTDQLLEARIEYEHADQRAQMLERENARLIGEMDENIQMAPHAERVEAAAQEENGRLRAALKKIASCESHVPGDVVDIARIALTREEQ